jgi:hypothetical protein
MKQHIIFRYKEVDLEWFGWCMLCKKGKFKQLKLCYNGTAGWWVNSKTFLSVNQLRKCLVQ